MIWLLVAIAALFVALLFWLGVKEGANGFPGVKQYPGIGAFLSIDVANFQAFTMQLVEKHNVRLR